MSPAVGFYIIMQLVYTHPGYLKDQLTIHFVPLLNPDGYEFSRSNVRTFKSRLDVVALILKFHRTDCGGKTGHLSTSPIALGWISTETLTFSLEVYDI